MRLYSVMTSITFALLIIMFALSTFAIVNAAPLDDVRDGYGRHMQYGDDTQTAPGGNAPNGSPSTGVSGHVSGSPAAGAPGGKGGKGKGKGHGEGGGGKGGKGNGKGHGGEGGGKGGKGNGKGK